MPKVTQQIRNGAGRHRTADSGLLLSISQREQVGSRFLLAPKARSPCAVNNLYTSIYGTTVPALIKRHSLTVLEVGFPLNPGRAGQPRMSGPNSLPSPASQAAALRSPRPLAFFFSCGLRWSRSTTSSLARLSSVPGSPLEVSFSPLTTGVSGSGSPFLEA